MECLKRVRWEPPRSSKAVDRFLEDLGRAENICEYLVDQPEYEQLKRFVCNGDVNAVADAPWNSVIAFATYYLIFHKRDFETARKAVELLESRMLDDEEEAMLKILQAAYKAATNPPCDSQEMLMQYVEKVKRVPEPTRRVGLLKELVLMHFTGQKDAEAFKDKIQRMFEERKTVVHHCNKAGCSKETIYHPMPFHHFAFYIVDRVRPLCPQEEQPKIATFEECLDEKKSYKKIANMARVPVAVAILALLFHKFFTPFVLATAFYLLWTLRQLAKDDAPVCMRKAWDRAGWMLKMGNLAPLMAYIAAGIINRSDLSLMATSLLGVLAAMGGFVVYASLEPDKPRGVYFPKIGARDEAREYRRFLEDLVDASWDMGNLCNGWLPFEHYNKLRALVCRDDLEAAEKVTENYPLIFVAYYLMLHRRKLETAEKVLNLLKGRNLDEKDKAALEILETVRKAVRNPPCGKPETLRQYVEKISSVQTYGWASLLKALVVAHLTSDEDYKDDVKLAILWTVKKCHCDNLSICYFAYRLLNRTKPLCPD